MLLRLFGRRRSQRHKRRPGRTRDLLGLLWFLCFAVAALLALGHLDLLAFARTVRSGLFPFARCSPGTRPSAQKTGWQLSRAPRTLLRFAEGRPCAPVLGTLPCAVRTVTHVAISRTSICVRCRTDAKGIAR